MKKTILKLSAIMLLMILMLLIPNTVNAQSMVEFDYSQIKALDQELPKLYELDENIGEILNQDWTDENGTAITGSNLKAFEIGKIYKYTAEIRLNEPDAFIEIINPPPALEGGSYSVSRLGVDTIGIEIVTAIPKEYKLTVSAKDSLGKTIPKDEFEKYSSSIIIKQDREIGDRIIEGWNFTVTLNIQYEKPIPSGESSGSDDYTNIE